MAIGNVEKKVTQLVHNNLKRKVKSSQLENYFLADNIVGKSKKVFPFQTACKIEIEKATSFENSSNIFEDLFGIKTSDTNTSSESYYLVLLKKDLNCVI